MRLLQIATVIPSSETLATVVLQTSLLIATVGIICRLCRRAAPQFRYALWGIVLLRLWIPIPLKSSLGLQSWITGAFVPHETQHQPASTQIPAPAFVSPIRESAPPTEFSMPIFEETFIRTSPSEPIVSRKQEARTQLDPNTIFMGAWFICVFTFGAAILWRSILLRHRISGCPLLNDEALLRHLDRLRLRLGLRYQPRVRVAETSMHLPMPAVLGVWRPTIVLPRYMVETWKLEEIEPVLLHELVHLARRDPLVNLLQIIAQVLYFFHPLVWWAMAQMRKERELAVDDEVIRRSGNQPAQYARCLLRAVELRGAAPMLGFLGLAMAARKSSFGGRVRRIMDSSYRANRLTWIGSTAVVLVGAAALTVSCARSHKPQAPVADATKSEVIESAQAFEPTSENPPNSSLHQGTTVLDRVLDDLPSIGSQLRHLDGDGVINFTDDSKILVLEGGPESLNVRVETKLQSKTFNLSSDQSNKIRSLLDSDTLKNVIWGQTTPPIKGAELTLDARQRILLVVGSKEHIQRVEDFLKTLENAAVPDMQMRFYRIRPEDGPKIKALIRALLEWSAKTPFQLERKLFIEGDYLIVRDTPENLDLIEELLRQEGLLRNFLTENSAGRLEIANFSLIPLDVETLGSEANRYFTQRVFDQIKTLLYAADGVDRAKDQGRLCWFDESGLQVVIIDTPSNIARVGAFIESLPQLRQRRQQKVIFLKNAVAEEVAAEIEKRLHLQPPSITGDGGGSSSTTRRLRRSEQFTFRELRVRLLRVNEGDPNDRKDDQAVLQLVNGTKTTEITLTELQSQYFENYEITADNVQPSNGRSGAGPQGDGSAELSLRHVPPIATPGTGTADASSVIATPPGLTISPYGNLNALIIRYDNPALFSQVEGLVKQLDQPKEVSDAGTAAASQRRQQKVIFLKNADAGRMASELGTIMNLHKPPPKDGPPSSEIEVMPNGKLNALVVRYENQAILKDMEELIRQLDIPISLGDVRVIPPGATQGPVVAMTDGIWQFLHFDHAEGKLKDIALTLQITSKNSVIFQVRLAESRELLSSEDQTVEVPETSKRLAIGEEMEFKGWRIKMEALRQAPSIEWDKRRGSFPVAK